MACRVSLVVSGLLLVALEFVVLAESPTGEWKRGDQSQCAQHKDIASCIIFRNQHGCVWDVAGETCVADTPCEQRPKDSCQSELTTGKVAQWDVTSNKCIWDAVQHVCRWADECFGHGTEHDCVVARCAWKTKCTPADMSFYPGPEFCKKTCVAPESQILPYLSGGNISTKRRQSIDESAAAPLTNIVSTIHGDIQGSDLGSVQQFLGIPFAQPPIGNLRWSPPQALQPAQWHGVFKAVTAGAACVQTSDYYFNDANACQGYTRGSCYGYSEDCLTLNTWTPSTSGSRPVMVWIHGGCFVSGSASEPSYNGASMASEQDIVMVNIQYRLAVFGFLGDDRLRPRDPKGSTGNYGLMDNIAALEWIAKNIAHFGGDPDRVTIFGESSGAGSVSQLLGVQSAWPYFHRGIMESGTGSFWTYMDVEAAYRNFERVVDATSCNTSDVVECLINTPAQALSSAVYQVPCRDGCTWAPVIDGIFVKGRTVELARAGQLRPNTPIIAGFNLNDGAMFVPNWLLASATMTSSSLKSYYAKRFGIERVAVLEQTFPVESHVTPSYLSRYFYSAQECETDFSYACSAQWVADSTSTSYVYQFSQPTSNGLVLHGDEIGYVFGTLSSPSAEQQNVTRMMMGFWANFAKNGDPNSANLPLWPAWGASAELLNISFKPSIASFPKGSFLGCSFFNSNWDYYGGCLPENPGSPPSLVI